MISLAKKIQMPKEVIARIEIISKQADDVLGTKAVLKLFSKETWNSGLKELKELLGDDPDGMKMLAVMLKAALISQKKYTEIGIGEEIFVETMKCFTRFVKESMVRGGRYYFNREWWTPRQLSLQLFRIGELEYELVEEKSQKYIYLHIPSDADMDTSKLRASYEQAKLFLINYFPAYQDAPMRCESWLMSPALSKLLPETSGILRFQQNFTVEEIYPGENDYAEWVYNIEGAVTGMDMTKLPENTFLQRSMKQYLLGGGSVGTALATLVEDPFRI